MQDVGRRLKIFGVLFLFATAAGTVGFMVLEDLSFVEALYYCIVTMSTVGYGDIHPTREASRVFAVLLIVMGGAAFVGLVANGTELVMLRRETRSRMQKVNMLLGVFFSEVGFGLLKIFSDYDRSIDTIRTDLLVQPSWKPARFLASQQVVGQHKLKLDLEQADLEALLGFLKRKRKLLIDLLENPVLVGQEEFSDVLLAVFHLADELSCRENLGDLPQTDRNHLAGDVKRAYRKLLEQWLVHLMHLKVHYPYLFSLAVRQNPFDPQANPVVSR